MSVGVAARRGALAKPDRGVDAMTDICSGVDRTKDAAMMRRGTFKRGAWSPPPPHDELRGVGTLAADDERESSE